MNRVTGISGMRTSPGKTKDTSHKIQDFSSFPAYFFFRSQAQVRTEESELAIASEDDELDDLCGTDLEIRASGVSQTCASEGG